MATKNGGAIPSLQYCEYLNISVCPASEAADSVSLIASPTIACHSGNILNCNISWYLGFLTNSF